VAIDQKNLRVEFVGEEQPTLPETTTITQPLEETAVRVAIAHAVVLAEELEDDLRLAVQVRRRVDEDTGERLTLVELIEEQGFDPADFGVE
jgi:hypothetical protein